MKRFAIAFAMGLIASGVWVAVPAQASGRIVCRTALVSEVQNRVTVRVISNKPIYYGQTSLIGRYVAADQGFRSLIMDAGYGSTVSVVRPRGSREWVDIRTWHAGTECARYTFRSSV